MIKNFKLRLVNHNTKFNSPLNDITYYYDFTFVLSGKLVYIIDGVHRTIPAGSAILFPPGFTRIREPIYEDVENLDYFSINFFTDEVFDFPPIMYDCVTPLIKSSLDTIDLIYNSYSSNIEERIELEINQLIFTLKELNKVALFTPEVKYDNPKIQAITSYIDTHLTEKLSLEKISQHVSLTPSYCATLMKRETGMSVFDYIINNRMELAKELIIKGKKSLNEISEYCGYNDYAYFSKHFKRVIGSTPSKFQSDNQ